MRNTTKTAAHARIKKAVKAHKPVKTAKRKVDAQGLTASERALAEPITGDGEPEALSPEAQDAFMQMLAGLETARASKGDSDEDLSDNEIDDFGDSADDFPEDTAGDDAADDPELAKPVHAGSRR